MDHRKRSHHPAARALALALTLALPWTVQAQCSRSLNVPVAPIGLSVTTVGDAVGGLYPDLLRSLAGKDGCSVEFSVVPQARLEAMFESGRADLLVPPPPARHAATSMACSCPWSAPAPC